MKEEKTKNGAIFSKDKTGDPIFDMRKSNNLLKDMNRAIISETKRSGSEIGAINWFINAIESGQMVMPPDVEITTDLIRSRERMATQGYLQLPGRMFTFFYNPKTKAKLPYYDITPLIITLPIEEENPSGRILGINLHYIEPELRAELIDRLLQFAYAKKGEKNPPKGVGFFRVDYSLLNARRFVFGIPCVRSYDPARIIGRPVLIPANEWGNAVALPYNNFVKANENRVWLESRAAIRKFIQSIGSR